MPASTSSSALRARISAELKEVLAADGAVHIHVGTPDAAMLMSQADLAIGAGGGTSWERACVGLPTIVAATAGNQRSVVIALCEEGCAVEVAAGADFERQLDAALVLLESNPALVRRLGQAAFKIVDGRGAARVRRVLFPPQVSLRRAVASDARAVWEWRNDARVRADPGRRV